MHSPLQPWQRPPTPSQYLGTDASGQPVYGTPATHPATPPVAPLQPIVARPWGAYLAGGSCVAVIGFLFLIGLAIVAAVLATATVSLTICTVVLRSMWRDYQREKEW